MVDKRTSHGLGFGNGSLIEYPDGSVEFRQTGKMLPAFKVQINEVTGFALRKATRDDKKRLDASSLQQILTLQGQGTHLAEVAVNYGTGAKVEAWFRAHPLFGHRAATKPNEAVAASAAPISVADELIKLAQLRDAGVLTADEFEAQKSRLLD